MHRKMIVAPKRIELIQPGSKEIVNLFSTSYW